MVVPRWGQLGPRPDVLSSHSKCSTVHGALRQWSSIATHNTTQHKIPLIIRSAVLIFFCENSCYLIKSGRPSVRGEIENGAHIRFTLCCAMHTAMHTPKAHTKSMLVG